MLHMNLSGNAALGTQMYPSIHIGCVAQLAECQLAERRSLAGELTLSCARPAADG